MMRIIANSPAILGAYLRFNQAFEEVKMPAKLRALITTTVAELNGCDYTLSVAMILGRHVGLSQDELNAARQIRPATPKRPLRFTLPKKSCGSAAVCQQLKWRGCAIMVSATNRSSKSWLW
jgi:alkylhydroperoxidase family enzyme